MATLMVAGAGGHLEELVMLRPRLQGLSEPLTWVTSDTSQARHLLAGEERVDIPKSRPHDVAATLSTTATAVKLLGTRRFEQVVSTGSLPAVPFIGIGRARGLSCHFIESAARVSGPSLSARMLEKVPGVHRYGQHDWGRTRWHYRGSVFDGFSAYPNPQGRPGRILVTVGTSPFGFRRLIETVLAVAPPQSQIIWQTGASDLGGLGVQGVPTMTCQQLAVVMEEVDVVIAHGGVGSALMAMQAGKPPILVPRERIHGEHVDDHQSELVSVLASSGLASACSASDLDREAIEEAARRSIAVAVEGSPFVLKEG
ncbi:MAG: glycosyltransferase [Acidimicrobiales bacterium]